MGHLEGQDTCIRNGPLGAIDRFWLFAHRQSKSPKGSTRTHPLPAPCFGEKGVMMQLLSIQDNERGCAFLFKDWTWIYSPHPQLKPT